MPVRDRSDRRSGEQDHTAQPASTFLRGLTVGALVGAAIAGSVLVQRGRQRTGAARTGTRAPEREAGSTGTPGSTADRET